MNLAKPIKLGVVVACAAAWCGCVELMPSGAAAVVAVKPPAQGVAVASTAPAGGARLGFRFETTDDAAGCRVTAVYPGLAAERAGIHPGDFVLAVDGAPVGYPDCTQPIFARHRPGDRIVVRVCRETTALDLPAVLDASDGTEFSAAELPRLGWGPRPQCAP